MLLSTWQTTAYLLQPIHLRPICMISDDQHGEPQRLHCLTVMVTQGIRLWTIESSLELTFAFLFGPSAARAFDVVANVEVDLEMLALAAAFATSGVAVLSVPASAGCPEGLGAALAAAAASPSPAALFASTLAAPFPSAVPAFTVFETGSFQAILGACCCRCCGCGCGSSGCGCGCGGGCGGSGVCANCLEEPAAGALGRPGDGRTVCLGLCLAFRALFWPATLLGFERSLLGRGSRSGEGERELLGEGDKDGKAFPFPLFSSCCLRLSSSTACFSANASCGQCAQAVRMCPPGKKA